MEKKIYSKPVAEYLRLNTKEDVMNRELAKHYREHPEDFKDE